MQIIKRDGSKVDFDRNKITVAIKKALEACDMASDTIALSVTEDVVQAIGDVEEIDQERVQDLVEDALMKRGMLKVAKAYIKYRYRHAMVRDHHMELVNGVLDKLSAKHVVNQNANIDEASFGGRMGEANTFVLKTLAMDFKMSDKTKNNYVQNIVYQHDAEHWATGEHNCLTLPLDKLLEKGFLLRQGDIRPPQSISTALQQLVVIMQLQSTQMYGGVAAMADFALVPYVRKSFKKHYLKRAFEEYMHDRILMDKEPTGDMKDALWKFPTKASWYALDDEHLDFVEKAFNKWYMEVMGLDDADFCFACTKLDASMKSAAMQDTRKETLQAVEGLYHNLVSIQARSGAALPFSSLNYGCCTEPEGRLVTECIILGCMRGIGKHHSTAIFPCGIFISKAGVNRHPGEPNYDLFQLALASTAKRLYPNYANANWTNQQSWVKDDREKKAQILESLTETEYAQLKDRVAANPAVADKLMLLIKDDKLIVDETERPFEYMSSMGCVSGDSIIDYKIGERRFVESFQRAWNRLAGMYEIKTQPNGRDLYIDTPDVSVYDCVVQKYVKQYRIIRNRSRQWLTVDFSGGRTLDVTPDHPFEVLEKGVVMARDLVIGDVIHRDVNNNRQPEAPDFDRKMWLEGLVLCDASIAGSLNLALGLDETDLLDEAERGFNDLGYECTRREQHRGSKGDYAELYVKMSRQLCCTHMNAFEGNIKLERKIPTAIFNASRSQKLSFMAGMIDADGYVNDYGNTIRVQIGSTNRELAMGQMILAKDIGLNAVMYRNRYNSADPSKIRWRIEFPASYELFSYLVSGKKRAHLHEEHKFVSWAAIDADTCSVTQITPYEKGDYSYDVTTESDHFTVNGVYSHNCRTVNGYDINSDISYKQAIHEVIETGDTTVDLLSGAQKTGRGNIAPVTIILPELAMMANRDVETFMQLLEITIQEAADSLIERYEIVKSQPPSAAPFQYCNHTMAGYIEGEGIDTAIRHGTFAIGQLGVAETLQLLIGTDQTTPEGLELAKRIEQLYKDKINALRVKYKINFGVYASPAENLAYTALKKFQAKYGKIPNVSDKEFFTNSMHVPVWRKMSPFDKIDIESQLTGYFTAGIITYVELDSSVRHNLEALEKLVLYAMDRDIPYFAINTPNDQCQDCGYEGDLPGPCIKCGSPNIKRLRRITGYLSSDYHHFNLGKQDEVEHRVKHIG